MKQIWLIAVLVSVMSTAQTQNMSDQQQLAELANMSTDAAVFSKVQAIFAHDEQKLSGCAEMGTPAPEGITAFTAPAFINKQLERAEWQVRYRVRVCGQERLRTALFSVKNGDELSITSLLPGSTQADMALQADVRNSFFVAATNLKPDCRTPQIIQTQVTQKPADENATWQEIWTGDFCGTKVAQTIDFYPNAEGTAFTMSLIK